MDCEILDKIVMVEPIPEMNDEFNDMSELEQDCIGYEEGKEYYVDEEGYNKLSATHHLKMAKHMIECHNDDCKNVLKNWENDKELNKYVEEARV